MSRTPIIDMLKKIAESANLRFCMPGHKGKPAFFGSDINKFDITELTGTDNLYNPDGVIAESECNYADFIGAKDSFFLVNGSSCGVHAAVLSVLNPGDEVIAARDFHLSAAHAFALSGVVPHFIYSGIDKEGMFNIITPSRARQAVKQYPRSKAVYLTYPDYWGRCAELSEICRIAHNAGMKVICDAAHAAAFDYSKMLPESPADAGCDIWTVSPHKTLPAMNQCAVLCTGLKSGIESTLVQSRLNLIQTTSPSYILLASIDYALSYMREYGEAKLNEAIEKVIYIKNKIEKLGGYRCLPYYPGNHTEFDALKLSIDVSNRGISGFFAAEQLEKSGIFIEAADTKRILLICTVADDKSDFDMLYTALKHMTAQNDDKTADLKISAEQVDKIFNASLETGIREAVFAPRETVSTHRAEGRISAVCAGAYPPGVPVLLPGQIISRQTLDYLKMLSEAGYSLFGLGKSIETVKL